MSRQFLKKPLCWAKAPDNVRTNLGTEEELISLGNSYKKRPIHPLIAKLDGTMIDGWRRVNSLRRIGEIEAEFLVTDEDLKPEDIVQIGLVSAMHRQALSDVEVYQGCKKLMQLHPQWLRKDLAAALDLDPSMVTKILSVDELIAEAREAFLAGKFGFSVVYSIAKLPADQQAAAVAAKLNGMTRDALAASVRKHRNGQGGKGDQETVKVTRIKCEVPGRNATITIAGQDISLVQAIEIVQDWLRDAKRAADQGISAKSFEKVCRDKARS